MEAKGVNNNEVLLAVEIKDGKMQVRINTNNEAWLALALRKAGQAVDFYLEEQEIKKQNESLKLVKAPASIIDRLR